MNPQDNNPANKPPEPSDNPVDNNQLFQEDPVSTTPENTQQPANANSKKKLFIFIAVAVFILITGVLVFAVMGQSSDTSSNDSAIQTTTPEQNDEQKSADAESATEQSMDQVSMPEGSTENTSSNEQSTSGGSDTATTTNTNNDTSSSSGSSGGSNSPMTYDISYTNGCFNPADITINNGDTVRFTNNSNKSMWPASDNHPSHTKYPEFDSNGNISSGGNYSFTFTNTGAWGYHDHIKPGCTGTITVN